MESFCKLADVWTVKLCFPLHVSFNLKNGRAGSIILLFAFVAKDPFGRDPYCKGLNNVYEESP